MHNAIKATIVVSMLTLVAACGGSSKSTKSAAAPTSAPVSDAAFKTAAATAAKSVQIVASDLPAGWSGMPHEPNTTQLDLSPACTFFNAVDPWTNAVANINSDDFTGPADSEIKSQAVAYRTVDVAKGDSSVASKLVTQCADEIGRALEASIVAGESGATAHVSLTPLVASDLGGWTAGYKASLSATSAAGEKTFSVVGAILWKVSGRMIGTLEYSGSEATPVDSSLIDTIKSLIAKRTADADALLPN